jgi:hypothetical protein
MTRGKENILNKFKKIKKKQMNVENECDITGKLP